MKNILVVEDDKAIAELLRFILEEAGLCVFHAANLEIACEIVNRAPFCAVLLDYILPDGEPTRFVRMVRQLEPSPPIIMMTAFSQAAQVAEALSITCVLKKPFDLESLVEKLEAVNALP